MCLWWSRMTHVCSDGKWFLVQTSKWGQRALHAQSCCMPWACQCLRHCRQKPKSPTAFQGACLDADWPQCEKADSGRCLKSVGGLNQNDPSFNWIAFNQLSLWCRVHREKLSNWKGVSAMMLNERLLDLIVHLKFDRGLSISFASGVVSRGEKLFN